MIKIRFKTVSIIGAIFLVSCSGGKENKQETETANIHDSFHQLIETTPAILKKQEVELTLSGKVEYNPDKVIRYIPLTNGIVDRVYFSTGDKITKGQKLLDLRSTELSQLKAEETSLRAEVNIAEREMKTVQSLFDDNMNSEKELLEAEAKLNQAKASLKRIETDMSFYHYNQSTGTFSIMAPMGGHIVDRNISSGSTISNESEPIFTIADLSTVWIMANVYAKDLLFVHEGTDTEIQLLSYPDRIFSGKITKISNVFDKEERILKAWILMDNKELLFKPEMSAVIKLKNKSEKEMIAIPSDALVFDNNRYYVVVEKENEKFEVREVKPGNSGNGTTYLESGLSAGENVVTKNQLLVYSQLK